jgi:hypothetical protein
MELNIKMNINQLHGLLKEELGPLKVNVGYDRTLGNHIHLITENTFPTMDIRIKHDSGLQEGNTIPWVYLSDNEDNTSGVHRTSPYNELHRDIIDVFNKRKFNTDYLDKISPTVFEEVISITTPDKGEKKVGFTSDHWFILNENLKPIFTGKGGMDEVKSFLGEFKS